MSASNTKSNTKTKTSHERKVKNLSPVEVSLDNADTVIEGGPGFVDLNDRVVWRERDLSLVASGFALRPLFWHAKR
jgi:hypothetical protein